MKTNEIPLFTAWRLCFSTVRQALIFARLDDFCVPARDHLKLVLDSL